MASSPSVKSTRLRRSETEKIFFRLSASIVALAPGRAEALRSSALRQYLCRTAGGGNLLGRFSAELVRADRELLRDVAAREHLDPARASDEPVLAQQFRGDVGACVEPLGDRVEVHHLVLDAERIV